MKVLVVALAAVLMVAGCSSEAKADPVACKAAMGTSSTGPAQWSVDKSSWPAECKGMDDAAFNKLSTEWYTEFVNKLATP